MLINQGSDRAVINWQSFSIGSGEMTKFVQPSSTSAALNRVLGGQMSIINGTLSANGQVFLLNGNGIVVGPGGVINTGGFVGSTRDISDSDFMSGNLHFVGSGDGEVKNLGTITALGGDVVLIGKTVENRGTIKATGTAALVAGDDVLLAQKNADGSTVTVNPVSSPTATRHKVGVKNTGVIEASTAELKAANGNIYALAIQNEGLVQATTVTHQGGHIYLTSDAGTIVNSGTLDASATAAGGKGGTVLVKSTTGKVVHSGSLLARGGAGGTGGRAEISAPVVNFTGTVDLRADGGKTGSLLLDPANLVVNGSGAGSASNTSYLSNSSVDDALNNADFTLNADDSIAINAEIDWTSGTTLTLSTNVGGSTIRINAPINGPGGSLTLDTFGSSDVIGTSAGGAVDVANFYLQSGAWFQVINDGSGNGGNLAQTYDVHGNPLSILPAFTVTNDFEIDNGATFLRADSGNGSTVYYGLQDIYGVQGISGFLTSNFTLNGRYIDASVTANWNPTMVNGNTVNEGFLPIGFGSEVGFTGSLQNGTIANLTIDRAADGDIGLFSKVVSTGFISNVELDYAAITGADDVGGFAGENFGQIDNATFFDGSVTGTSDVGGIAGFQGSGYLDENGDQIHTNGSQTGYGTITGVSEVGGLVGENEGQIDGVSVYNTVVTGNTDVGGVVGQNDYIAEGPQATIVYATFSGTVAYEDNEGESFALGGIVGENDGFVALSNTYPGSSDSPTTVTGDYDVGGIAGYNTGTIEDSYNSAAVSGANNDYALDDAYVGGITGENSALQNEQEDSFFTNYAVGNQPSFEQYGTVQTSYNTGTITGSSYVGGLVGSNDYANNIVNTAYNVGQVTGGGDVGGIVGDNYGTVEDVYDSGPVSGGDAGTTGALAGDNEIGGIVTNSYWDDSITGNAGIALNGTPGINIGTIETTGTAYEIDDNDTSTGAGYGYFGTATPESDLTDLINNGVYEIGTLPSGDSSTANSGAAWFILPGDTRPILTMEFTGNVANAHELQLISTDLGGGFYVQQNIDASVVTNPSEVWSSAGFSPIGGNPGQELNGFSGNFYGNGETITSLYINRPGTNGVGLFGYVDAETDSNYNVESINFSGASITGAQQVGTVAGINNGVIEYVTVGDSTVTGTSDVGGIAGANTSGGMISNVSTTTDGSGSVTGSDISTMNVGGIVGDNGGSVTLAQNALNVTGDYAVGGIAGANESTATVSQSANTGTITGSGYDQEDIGGIAGNNAGTVTQTLNTGDVGVTGNTSVGGLVGANFGQVDDSYSGGATANTITGASLVGGLVGANYGTVETSYSTSDVDSAAVNAGFLVGANFGAVLHSYWDTDTVGATAPAGIGDNETGATTTDVTGYTTAQLTDANDYAQGDQPALWNFNPQGTNAGVWGINVYQGNETYDQQTNSYVYSNSQVNGGLPVLQWQTPVNVAVTATNGTQNYGYTPGYTVSGSGASTLATNMPGGVTSSESGGNQAGDTDQITVAPTAFNTSGYNVEFINGTVNVVPAPLYIVADSYVVPVGGATPNYGAVYTGLQNGDTPSSLTGMLDFTVDPNATQVANFYSILVGGQSSPNYAIHFIPGTLDVYTPTGAPSLPQVQAQTVLTAQAEGSTIANSFANDPANGLNPIFFLIIPDQLGLGEQDGDEIGAVNNKPRSTDYAYASSTSHMPAFSRLVLPETGVVQITDGAVVVGSPQTGQPIFLTNPGGFLPSSVVANFQSVLSPATAAQLLALINGQ